MFRRALLKLLALAPMSKAMAITRPRKRYEVPPTLWYENHKGDRWIAATENFDHTGRPEGFDYQRSQFPMYLRDTCIKIHETGGTQIFAGERSWPEDLVMAMAVSKEYALSDAILIAAGLCERCMNAAAFDYGLTWGYRRHSADYEKCGTSCEFCIPSCGAVDSDGIRRKM